MKNNKLKTGFYSHPEYGYYLYVEGWAEFLFLGCKSEYKKDIHSEIGDVDYDLQEFRKELTFVTNNIESLIKREIETFLMNHRDDIKVRLYDV